MQRLAYCVTQAERQGTKLKDVSPSELCQKINRRGKEPIYALNEIPEPKRSLGVLTPKQIRIRFT
jgi:hypothetical protein